MSGQILCLAEMNSVVIASDRRERGNPVPFEIASSFHSLQWQKGKPIRNKKYVIRNTKKGFEF